MNARSTIFFGRIHKIVIKKNFKKDHLTLTYTLFLIMVASFKIKGILEEKIDGLYS